MEESSLVNRRPIRSGVEDGLVVDYKLITTRPPRPQPKPNETPDRSAQRKEKQIDRTGDCRHPPAAMEEEKKMKLCFSIPSKPKVKPATPPAAFSVTAGKPGPAPRFVTVFDPSETLTPAAAVPVVIAPLPDSRKPSPAPAAPVVIAPLPNTRKLAEDSAGSAPALVLGASDSPSSSAGYGLTVRNTESKRKIAPEDAAREPPPPAPSGEDLMLRRFKEDMAVLPEIQGTDEYDEVPVEGFGAALLVGYGWKEGDPIGKKYKGMGGVKVREHGRRRCGTQGLGS